MQSMATARPEAEPESPAREVREAVQASCDPFFARRRLHVMLMMKTKHGGTNGVVAKQVGSSYNVIQPNVYFLESLLMPVL